MSNDCFGCSDAFGGLPRDVSLDVASTVDLVLETGIVGDLLAEVLSIHSNLIRDFHEGDLIVKRNFGPEGVTEDEVLRNPDEHLAAYTVMFRRAAGYDPENADWYWVKYLPDGALDQTPDGVAMAGQVAKGMDEGCIACHQSAGEDMVFTSDHLAD